jgi:hypothetical protein
MGRRWKGRSGGGERQGGTGVPVAAKFELLSRNKKQEYGAANSAQGDD